MGVKNVGCLLIKTAQKKYQIANQCEDSLKVKGYCLQCLECVLGNYSKNNWNKWCNGWSTDENDFLPFMGVIIPKGTIEKIIGRKISWEDEPVEVRF